MIGFPEPLPRKLDLQFWFYMKMAADQSKSLSLLNSRVAFYGADKIDKCLKAILKAHKAIGEYSFTEYHSLMIYTVLEKYCKREELDHFIDHLWDTDCVMDPKDYKALVDSGADTAMRLVPALDGVMNKVPPSDNDLLVERC